MWNTIIYEPLYNLFALILSNIPNHNIAFAIVILTIVIKTVLFPLYHKSIKGQQIMKKLQPEIKKLQEKYKDDRNELGKKTLELYREHKINPFISILLIFIQLPILIGLYFVFSKGLTANPEHLYSFVTFPESINTFIFGFIDSAKPFIPFAILAGLTQAIQARVSFPKEDIVEKKDKKEVSFQDEFAKSMRIQMLYILPAFITVISLGFPSAITLYWIVSNIYGIGQELFVRKTIKV